MASFLFVHPLNYWHFLSLLLAAILIFARLNHAVQLVTIHSILRSCNLFVFPVETATPMEVAAHGELLFLHGFQAGVHSHTAADHRHRLFCRYLY